MLGIVSNPELVKAMQVMLLVVPPATQATFKVLLELLGGLIKLNPKTTKSHHDTLTTAKPGHNSRRHFDLRHVFADL